MILKKSFNRVPKGFFFLNQREFETSLQKFLGHIPGENSRTKNVLEIFLRIFPSKSLKKFPRQSLEELVKNQLDKFLKKNEFLKQSLEELLNAKINQPRAENLNINEIQMHKTSGEKKNDFIQMDFLKDTLEELLKLSQKIF